MQTSASISRADFLRGAGHLSAATFLALLAGCATRPISNETSSLQCAPYARRVSGIDLYGDGGDWWAQAAGRYRRTHVPSEGAIIVFARSSRLRHGHVSVVESIDTSRRIRVRHANWQAGRVASNQPVLDVSSGNDWSAVRVWWPPTGSLGITVYPVLGFILPA